MTEVIKRLRELRAKVNGGEYVTPGENSLADDLMELIDIVGDIASEKQNPPLPAAENNQRKQQAAPLA